MKRISLAFGIAAAFAIAAPLSAQGKYDRNNRVYDRNGDGRIDSRDQIGTNNCRWYDVNCSTNSSTLNGGWYPVGRDKHGNVLYERRTTDRHGNAVIQTARQNRNGKLVGIHTRRIDNRGVLDSRGNTRNSGVYDRGVNRRGDDDEDDDRDDDDRYENRGRDNGQYDVRADDQGKYGKGKHGRHD